MSGCNRGKTEGNAGTATLHPTRSGESELAKECARAPCEWCLAGTKFLFGVESISFSTTFLHQFFKINFSFDLFLFV